MCDFHPGQEVICVNDEGVRRWLRKGTHYTISKVAFRQDLGQWFVGVAEVPSSGPDGVAWYPSRFAPLRKTDISVFTAILKSTKVPEHV